MAEGTELLGAADFGSVGTWGEKREDYLGAVNGFFDVDGPGVARVDAGGVEPDVEGCGGQIVLEAEGEFRAVLAGIGDKDAGVRRLCHGRIL